MSQSKIKLEILLLQQDGKVIISKLVPLVLHIKLIFIKQDLLYSFAYISSNVAIFIMLDLFVLLQIQIFNIGDQSFMKL